MEASLSTDIAEAAGNQPLTTFVSPPPPPFSGFPKIPVHAAIYPAFRKAQAEYMSKEANKKVQEALTQAETTARQLRNVRNENYIDAVRAKHKESFRAVASAHEEQVLAAQLAYDSSTRCVRRARAPLASPSLLSAALTDLPFPAWRLLHTGSRSRRRGAWPRRLTRR
jgi:hypothetical protein